MKNTKKKLKNLSKVVKSSFTGSNITKYSGLNTVAKYMNRQHIVKSISSSFPTVWHNATKFGVNQVLIAITMASISVINRIYRIAVFSGDGLVKVKLKNLKDLLKAQDWTDVEVSYLGEKKQFRFISTYAMSSVMRWMPLSCRSCTNSVLPARHGLNR